MKKYFIISLKGIYKMLLIEDKLSINLEIPCNINNVAYASFFVYLMLYNS